MMRVASWINYSYYTYTHSLYSLISQDFANLLTAQRKAQCPRRELRCLRGILEKAQHWTEGGGDGKMGDSQGKGKHKGERERRQRKDLDKDRIRSAKFPIKSFIIRHNGRNCTMNAVIDLLKLPEFLIRLYDYFSISPDSIHNTVLAESAEH